MCNNADVNKIRREIILLLEKTVHFCSNKNRFNLFAKHHLGLAIILLEQSWLDASSHHIRLLLDTEKYSNYPYGTAEAEEMEKLTESYFLEKIKSLRNLMV